MQKKMIYFLLVFVLVSFNHMIGQNFDSNATIDQEFCGSSVIVIMDNNWRIQ
jgi:hypothetical protein